MFINRDPLFLGSEWPESVPLAPQQPRASAALLPEGLPADPQAGGPRDPGPGCGLPGRRVAPTVPSAVPTVTHGRSQ